MKTLHVLILAVATSASAECAWVLWAETKGTRGYGGYEAVSAADTKQACDHALAGRLVAWTGTNVRVRYDSLRGDEE